MSNAKVGQMLMVEVDPRQNNGCDVAPALVTKVVDEDENRVNLRVFYDTGSDERLSNVEVADSRPDSHTEEVDDVQVGEDDDGKPQMGKGKKARSRVAFPADN